MAETKTEKIYTIPLRRTFIKSEGINRCKVSVKTIRAYFERHLKAEDVKISKGINEYIWSHGAKKPPGKIKVKAEMKDKIVYAKLPDEKEEVKAEEKKPKTAMEMIKKRVAAKTAPPEKRERSVETKHEALLEVKAGE